KTKEGSRSGSLPRLRSSQGLSDPVQIHADLLNTFPFATLFAVLYSYIPVEVVRQDDLHHSLVIQRMFLSVIIPDGRLQTYSLCVRHKFVHAAIGIIARIIAPFGMDTEVAKVR